MKNLIVILILTVSYSCCKPKSEENPESDYALPATLLDYNSDGSPDIILDIINIGTEDVPQSSGLNIYTVLSADSNLTFWAKSVDLDDYLYEENKVIDLATPTNFSYTYFNFKLCSRKICRGNYCSEWKEDSEFNKNKIIVFQNKKSSTTKYGWIKLDFNILTKKLIIVDYYETTLSTITTGKK